MIGERVPEDDGATQLPRDVPAARGGERARDAPPPAGRTRGQLLAGRAALHRPTAQPDLSRLRSYTGHFPTNFFILKKSNPADLDLTSHATSLSTARLNSGWLMSS